MFEIFSTPFLNCFIDSPQHFVSNRNEHNFKEKGSEKVHIQLLDEGLISLIKLKFTFSIIIFCLGFTLILYNNTPIQRNHKMKTHNRA